MSAHMVNYFTYSEILSLNAPEQYLVFSEAYLDSAAHLCRALTRSPKKSSYARGTVILYLMLHGLELFLKAAILEKEPSTQFGGTTGHDIEHLSKRFANLYPGKKYTFGMPFKGADLSTIDPPLDEKAMLSIKEHKKNNPADQLHRYPRNKQGQPWEGIFAFEPYSCLKIITQLEKDVRRVKEIIFLEKVPVRSYLH